jgi:ABC-type polysaccharide/polyol phosphate export permease
VTDVETPIAASRPVPRTAEGPDGADAPVIRQRSNVTRVVSAETPLWQRLADIWSRRELLVRMVRTEISVKYKNSALGLMWSMLNPALNLAVYFLVFQVILKNGMPRFVIFLFSGLLLWNLFQVGVQTGTSVVVANAGLVKKVNFPREILSLASVGSALYFFLFQCVVMVVFMVVLHSAPAWNFLPLCLLALAATLVFASALGLFLSGVNVYLRDTQHLVEVLMTAWFWACPIVYQYQQYIGNKLGSKAWIYLLNPLVAPVLTFQRAIYAQVTVKSTNTPSSTIDVLPHHGMLWYATLDVGVLAASAVLFLVALGIFGRLEGNFAEEL